MTAAVIPPRRTPWQRLWRRLLIAWAWWELDSAERWVSDCVHDGIVDTHELKRQRAHIEALRVRLAVLQRG